jgi:hypothetical protein
MRTSASELSLLLLPAHVGQGSSAVHCGQGNGIFFPSGENDHPIPVVDAGKAAVDTARCLTPDPEQHRTKQPTPDSAMSCVGGRGMTFVGGNNSHEMSATQPISVQLHQQGGGICIAQVSSSESTQNDSASSNISLVLSTRELCVSVAETMPSTPTTVGALKTEMKKPTAAKVTLLGSPVIDVLDLDPASGAVTSAAKFCERECSSFQDSDVVEQQHCQQKPPDECSLDIISPASCYPEQLPHTSADENIDSIPFVGESASIEAGIDGLRDGNARLEMTKNLHVNTVVIGAEDSARVDEGMLAKEQQAATACDVRTSHPVEDALVTTEGATSGVKLDLKADL